MRLSFSSRWAVLLLVALFISFRPAVPVWAHESAAEYWSVAVDHCAKTTLGWLERVALGAAHFLLHAKLDTGADSSALHAEAITLSQTAGHSQVSFTLTNRYGRQQTYQQPVYRFTRVKTKDGKYQRRPVVRLGICLAQHYQVAEFSLVDRTHFSYPLLIGRNILAGAYNIDAAETYLSDPRCDWK